MLCGCKIQQIVCVMQLVFAQPVGVFFREQREVVELVAEFSSEFFIGGQRAEFRRAELVLLQFREQRSKFLRKTTTLGAAREQFQFFRVPVQQRAQDHQPPFAGQQFRRRDVQRFKNELREAVEGKDVQPREPGDFPTIEQLAFNLKRSLLGREEDERRAVRRGGERGADFGEAAEGLAAASGAEEEARLHTEILTQSRKGAKEFIQAVKMISSVLWMR